MTIKKIIKFNVFLNIIKVKLKKEKVKNKEIHIITNDNKLIFYF